LAEFEPATFGYSGKHKVAVAYIVFGSGMRGEKLKGGYPCPIYAPASTYANTYTNYAGANV
jgi:hypothetical protein